MSAPKIEIVENEDFPFSYEISQNAKGYCQMKVKVKRKEPLTSPDDYKELKNQFGKAFVAMQNVIISEDLKIQPDHDPIDQKHFNIVIVDLEQHEAEDIVQHLKDWAAEEDTPAIQDCMEIIPPKVKPDKK